VVETQGCSARPWIVWCGLGNAHRAARERLGVAVAGEEPDCLLLDPHPVAYGREPVEPSGDRRRPEEEPEPR
jgi:hypothetical protein